MPGFKGRRSMKAALLVGAPDGLTGAADWWIVGVSQARAVHGAACSAESFLTAPSFRSIALVRFKTQSAPPLPPTPPPPSRVNPETPS